MAEKFCLKWNDFQTNVSNSFRKLRTSDNFYDVTLVSDDQQQVSAHKVVLSSSSEYFKNILTSNKHSHPMLCLSGVNQEDLKNILDYVYNGEIQIYQDQLDQFLSIAQRFQLEGLMQGKEETSPEPDKFENAVESSNDNKKFAPKVGMENDNHIKSQKIITVESVNFENIEELDHKINDMIEKVDGTMRRRCIPCGKLSRGSSDAKEHAETHIEGLSFPCQYCEKTFRSRHSRKQHSLKMHVSINCLRK